MASAVRPPVAGGEPRFPVAWSLLFYAIVRSSTSTLAPKELVKILGRFVIAEGVTDLIHGYSLAPQLLLFAGGMMVL